MVVANTVVRGSKNIFKLDRGEARLC